VVDDEPAVLRTAGRILERNGYRVTSAANGREALEHFARDPSGFAAVLLDLTMPVMGGAETLLELRKLSQDVPVVLCSGYVESQVRESFGNPATAAVLEKPFTQDALLAVLQRVLG
jgi:CheY-like chemotaxis protein